MNNLKISLGKLKLNRKLILGFLMMFTISIVTLLIVNEAYASSLSGEIQRSINTTRQIFSSVGSSSLGSLSFWRSILAAILTIIAWILPGVGFIGIAFFTLQIAADLFYLTVLKYFDESDGNSNNTSGNSTKPFQKFIDFIKKIDSIHDKGPVKFKAFGENKTNASVETIGEYLKNHALRLILVPALMIFFTTGGYFALMNTVLGAASTVADIGQRTVNQLVESVNQNITTGSDNAVNPILKEFAETYKFDSYVKFNNMLKLLNPNQLTQDDKDFLRGIYQNLNANLSNSRLSSSEIAAKKEVDTFINTYCK